MHWYKGAEWRVNMASTFFGLSISYKGLQAAQTSITTTAHNLSNINTDGYTKQSVLLQASDALRTYSTYGTIGSGVNVVEIKQTRDSYYDEKYRNNCANYGQYEAKNNYMTQVEDYLNEFLLSGFSKEYGNFFDAVNQLTITPADTSAKNQLINNAKSMTDYFNTLANNLRNVQADANNEVKDTVEHINTLAQNITALNKQINQIEACYGDANDLRDQRNALVDELSKAVNITVSETEIQNGLTSFQITINGQSLVNDYSYRTLEVVARGEVRNTSDADGLYDIKWNDGAAVCVVLASGGYPRKYQTGYPIEGLCRAESAGALIFHAGTKADGDNILTSGGRVLGVTAVASNLDDAIKTAYGYVDLISFKDMHYRKDIGIKKYN